MKASEVLKLGLAKLDGGKAWTQGDYAVSATGEIEMPGSPKAAKFCAVGCVLGFPDYSMNVRHYLAKAMDGEAPTCWNDAPERTFADVEVAFQKAIQLAEAEGN